MGGRIILPLRWHPARQIGECDMSWKTPKILEIALGAEINCYACAEMPA